MVHGSWCGDGGGRGASGDRDDALKCVCGGGGRGVGAPVWAARGDAAVALKRFFQVLALWKKRMPLRKWDKHLCVCF